MKILRNSGYASARWKNGGGVTHEVMREPSVGDEFRWRLSMAEIESSGPFSDFTGYGRTLVLLDGAGMRLSAPGHPERNLARCGDLTCFDGSLAMHCELRLGRCVDLNLMVANSIRNVQAGVLALIGTTPIHELRDAIHILFCVQGAISVCDERGGEVLLDRWDTAICSKQDGALTCAAAADVRGATRVFLARIPSARIIG